VRADAIFPRSRRAVKDRGSKHCQRPPTRNQREALDKRAPSGPENERQGDWFALAPPQARPPDAPQSPAAWLYYHERVVSKRRCASPVAEAVVGPLRRGREVPTEARRGPQRTKAYRLRSTGRVANSRRTCLSASSRTNAAAAERANGWGRCLRPREAAPRCRLAQGQANSPRPHFSSLEHSGLRGIYGVWPCTSRGQDSIAAGVDCGRRQPRSLRRARPPTSPCRSGERATRERVMPRAGPRGATGARSRSAATRPAPPRASGR
jgi:hypothetical protein